MFGEKTSQIYFQALDRAFSISVLDVSFVKNFAKELDCVFIGGFIQATLRLLVFIDRFYRYIKFYSKNLDDFEWGKALK